MRHYRELLKILSSSLEKRRDILQDWVENNRLRPLRKKEGIAVNSLLEIVSDDPKERQQVLKTWLNQGKLCLKFKNWEEFKDLLSCLQEEGRERMEKVLDGQDMSEKLDDSAFQEKCKELLENFFRDSSSSKHKFKCG